MKFKDLVGKTIISAQLMKKPEYDDEAWAKLGFQDGSHCFVVSSYGSYSGNSEDEYPAYVFLQEDEQGLVEIEET
jgi:hypothetical protein